MEALLRSFMFQMTFVLCIHAHIPLDTTDGRWDSTCYAQFSKYDAHSFLANGRRSTPRECCHESYCEKQGQKCQTEQYRSYIANKFASTRSCPSGKVVSVTQWCKNHYDYHCIDICDALSSNSRDKNRCENGGTCVPHGTMFTCKCQPGYEGDLCETDIDECASSPCRNGSTCHDKVNGFTCECPPRIYGVLCDTNICHPTPADVVFVLDSSLSMMEQEFNKQLEFIANFSRQVPIGPDDFQISVVTFSYEAHVEFYLNQHNDNSTLLDAIKNITYQPGITRTDKGLEKVRTEVFSSKRGSERRINGTSASRFVYVLTDGMSTYREKTKKEANELRNNSTTVAVIGIGNEVLHQELIDIASKPSFVYSVKNFNSLYTVLKKLVHFDCDECETSAVSDVAIFLDVSSVVTTAQYSVSIDAIVHITDVMERLNINDTHVSITSFSNDITSVIGMGETYDKNAIKTTLNMITQSTDKDRIDLETVYAYARNNSFNDTFSRQEAKRFFLIFTNGNVEISDKNSFAREKSKLEVGGVNIFAIGSGEDVNLDGLVKLVTDTFNVFITSKDSPMSNLDVLQSEFVYNKCDLKGE